MNAVAFVEVVEGAFASLYRPVVETEHQRFTHEPFESDKEARTVARRLAEMINRNEEPVIPATWVVGNLR